MNEHTIAIVAAVLGVAFSVVWLVLGALGIKSLRDIRSQMRRDRR